MTWTRCAVRTTRAGSGERAKEASSSSLSGLERLLPRPEDDQPEKKKKLLFKEPTHEEAATEDINVGGYYLQTKNWKAALSRFESALVLDPENPKFIGAWPRRNTTGRFLPAQRRIT